MTPHTITSQTEAIKTLIKIVQGISKPPRASEKEMLVDRARAGVETLKHLEENIRASVGGRT